MIQGLPQDQQLETLRNTLRERFKNSSLQHSIDARYPIRTAHSTVIRFKAPITNSTGLIELLTQYRSQEFGVLEVKELEFVYNDWYQKAAHTQFLHQFHLKPPQTRDP
jgi:hypothetical protein